MKKHSIQINGKKYPVAIVTSISLFIILFVLAISCIVLNFQNRSLAFKFGLFYCGWVIWTLAEYILHRFLEHDVYSTVNLKRYHRHHHRNPGKLKVTGLHRSLMLVMLIVLYCLSFYSYGYVAFLTGIFSGFSFFCFIHYFLHKPIAAQVFPRLFKMHLYHHTKYPNLCFGVTTYFWDHVFKTIPVSEARISSSIKRFYYSGTAEKDILIAKK